LCLTLSCMTVCILTVYTDMEWLEGGGGGMVVDIGYMPEMALSITSPSVNVSKVNTTDRLPQVEFDVTSIEWLEEMLEYEAFRQMEKQMYPFTQVKLVV